MRILFVDDDGNVRGTPLRLPDDLGIEGDVMAAPGWYAITRGEYVGPFLTAGEAEYAIRLERQRQAERAALEDVAVDRDGEG